MKVSASVVVFAALSLLSEYHGKEIPKTAHSSFNDLLKDLERALEKPQTRLAKELPLLTTRDEMMNIDLEVDGIYDVVRASCRYKKVADDSQVLYSACQYLQGTTFKADNEKHCLQVGCDDWPDANVVSMRADGACPMQKCDPADEQLLNDAKNGGMDIFVKVANTD